MTPRPASIVPRIACRHAPRSTGSTHSCWRRRGRRGPQGPQRTCGTWPRCVVGVYGGVDWVNMNEPCAECVGCSTPSLRGGRPTPSAPIVRAGATGANPPALGRSLLLAPLGASGCPPRGTWASPSSATPSQLCLPPESMDESMDETIGSIGRPQNGRSRGAPPQTVVRPPTPSSASHRLTPAPPRGVRSQLVRPADEPRSGASGSIDRSRSINQIRVGPSAAA